MFRVEETTSQQAEIEFSAMSGTRSVSTAPSAPLPNDKEDKDDSRNTLDLSPAPSAGEGKGEEEPDADIEAPTTTKIPYLAPTADSFQQIKPNAWIQAPTTTTDFLSWANQNKPKWLREPNATTDEKLESVVNQRTRERGTTRTVKVAINAVATGVVTLGTVPYRNTRNIKPGEIHFSDNAGVPEIHLSQGLEYITSARHYWGKKYKTSETYIKEGNITIASILPGKIGIANEANNPVILLPGRHGYNSPVFNFLTKDIHDINNAIINCNPISIIRIQPHELGLAFDNGNPTILKPGLHIKNNPAFVFKKILNTRNLKASDDKPDQAPRECYEHGTISIVRVDKGKIGCAYKGSKPVLLQAGIHIRNSQGFKFEKIVSATSPHINFGTLHIVRVNQGQLGYAWHNNKSVELKPGVFEIDDAQFIFERLVSINDPVIQFGNITHIIVKDGEARATWDNGILKVLKAGRYTYDSPTLTVADDVISLQDVILTLHKIQVTAEDRSPLHVTGQVTYRVSDAEMLVNHLGQQKLKDYIEFRTHGILRHQISLTETTIISPEHHAMAEEKNPSGGLQLFGDKSKIEGDNYRGRLCTQIQAKLTGDFKQWGVEILEFAISDIGYQDPTIEHKLAEATARTREAEAQMYLQRAENIMLTAKIKSEAEQLTIKQQNSASVSIIDTKARNDTLLSDAKAKAEADVAAQKVQADAMRYVARAKRDSDVLQAQGEMALAKTRIMLLNNPGYVRLEELKLQAEIAKSLANMPTPAVVFNGEGSSNAANSMFFGDGTSLINLALKQKGNLFGAGRSKNPAEQSSGLVVDPSQQRTLSQ